MDELITKQQAIDALKQQADTMGRWSERYAEQRKGVLTAVNIVEDLPSAQPEQRTDLLKAEIKRMKRSFTACPNTDYYTGYMSALSAVEGYIAQLKGDTE